MFVINYVILKNFYKIKFINIYYLDIFQVLGITSGSI